MLLTIWRHGEAGDAASDFERRLTQRGEIAVQRGTAAFVGYCADLGVPLPCELRYSPWTRTRMTAAIVGQGLRDSGDCAELAEPVLMPGATVAEVDQLVETIAQETAPEHLLLVSHQPLVSRLIAHYLGDEGIVPPLTPGAYAMLSLEPAAAGCGQARFSAFPPLFEVCR